jgi:hypothetical protein
MKFNIHKIISFIVPLTAMLIVCRAFPVLSFLYYAVPVILFANIVFTLTPLRTRLVPSLKSILQQRELKTTIILVTVFSVWAGITSAWSSHPDVSLSRALYFFIISVSPLILGYLWRRFNENDLFGFLLPANILAVIVSMYSLLTSMPGNAWSGGHGMGFMGYSGHQNTLASVLVFTLPAVFYPLMKDFSGRVWNAYKGSTAVTFLPVSKIVFLSLLLIINLYLTLITVSRGAMLTLIVMVFLYVALSFNVKTSAGIIFFFITVFAVLFFTIQPVKEFTFKTENTIGDRRKVNISETIRAAQNGGLTGIGYGMSETPSDPQTRGRLIGDEKRFDREKMISALALVEETGITGLVLFLLPVVYVLRLLIKKYLSAFREKGVRGFALRSDAAIVISVLAALIFHAQIEGWWVGVGSVQLPMVFLMLNDEC